MGVSGFYRYILKNYPSCVKKDKDFLKSPYLFFDYNGLIHPVVQNVLKNIEEQNLNITEYELIQRICEEIVKYTDKIINYIKINIYPDGGISRINIFGIKSDK